MNFCVIGAGAWGTAMALHLNRQGHVVTLVPRRFEQALELSSSRENGDYLPGHSLPLSMQIGHELTPALMEAEVVLLACPSHGMRETCRAVAKNLGAARSLGAFVSLAKGLEEGTHLAPTRIMEELLPDYHHAVLAGPTSAAEVAEGKPTALVLAAGAEYDELEAVQAAVSGGKLRVYRGNDVRGVELGGCLKNIYAIAAGCGDGLRLGDNARAALLTRALAEMVRLGSALGARPETFYGLSGFGDLVATSHGDWSRNRTFGLAIGEGKAVAELLKGRRTVVEGYRTTAAFKELCEERKLEAPILNEVHAILYRAKNPADALNDLMNRDLKAETVPV